MAMRKYFGDDGEFVEDEQQEKIETEKDAINGANEDEVEGKELPGAMLDVPGKQNTRHRRDAGQQDQGEADSIGGQMAANAEFGDPIEVRNVKKSSRMEGAAASHPAARPSARPARAMNRARRRAARGLLGGRHINAAAPRKEMQMVQASMA